MVHLLAIAPHADDAELGAAGILARAAGQGRVTAILDLTRGERASNGTPEERAREAARAAEILGVHIRENLGLPDTAIDPRAPEQLDAVVAAVRRLRPEVVLVPAAPDRHPDHEAAAALVQRACFLAGLPRHAPELGEAWRPRAIYGYFVHARALPDAVVDVTPVYDRKLAALQAYASQFARDGQQPTYINDPGFLEAIAARDRYFGSLVGVRYGEGLTASRPLLLESL